MHVKEQILARDRELENPFSKDTQINAIYGARKYIGDKLIRVAKPHKLLEPLCGPLIAVRLYIITRKTLGGLQTNLKQVLNEVGDPIPGRFAADKVAGLEWRPWISFIRRDFFRWLSFYRP